MAVVMEAGVRLLYWSRYSWMGWKAWVVAAITGTATAIVTALMGGPLWAIFALGLAGMLLVVGVILLVQLRIASKGASSKADMRYESQPEGGVRAQQRMLEDIKRRAPADSPAEREVDSFHNRRMTPLSFLMMKIFGTLVLPEEQE